jgi:predicted dehydrogenase
VEAGYFAPGTYRDCVIVGERETLSGDFGTAEVKVLANRHVKQRSAWNAPEGAAETHKTTGPEPLSHELKLFLEACAHGTAPAVDVGAGLIALRVVEAAHQSSKLGRRVLVSELNQTSSIA